MNIEKYIIITSIFPPSEAIEEFAKESDWNVVVVGDRKTPTDWAYPGVVYLSPEDQEKLPFELIKKLPWNHYSRKMIGYLYAISKGASIIYDSDDDNIPLPNWKTPSFTGDFLTVNTKDFYNVYSYFSKEPIWPRGYPLNKIKDRIDPQSTIQNHRIGIWQFLADEDPDVDAIYRLVSDKEVYFEKKDPIVLEKNTISPVNSQNTFITKDFFPLLYLPTKVTFRFTDILRGLISQPLLWQYNAALGIGGSTVIQKRNPHSYMKDFEQEIPMYLHAEKVVPLIMEVLDQKKDMLENLKLAYGRLQQEGIVTPEEIEILNAWVADMRALQ